MELFKSVWCPFKQRHVTSQPMCMCMHGCAQKNEHLGDFSSYRLYLFPRARRVLASACVLLGQEVHGGERRPSAALRHAERRLAARRA